MEEAREIVPKESVKIHVIVASLSVVAAVLCIYLTPLKWFTLIEPTVRDISPTEFYEKYAEEPNRYIFLDVRSEEAFGKAHAVGSQNIPLHMLYDERHILPKTGKEVVLICSGGRASGVGYSYLQHYDFLNIWRVEGGIENWMLEDLPVEGTDV